MSWDLSDPMSETFFIKVGVSGRGVTRSCVSLRGGLSEEDRLRAYVQALAIERAALSWDSRRKMDREAVADVIDQASGIWEGDEKHKTSAWTRFSRQLKRAGWDTTKAYLRDEGYRADICAKL